MSLLDRIKAGTAVRGDAEWPGIEDGSVKMRLCTENDNLQATIATDKIFSDIKIGIENVDSYNAERETQLLCKSIEDPETKKQLYKNITDFRSVLTVDAKNYFADKLDELHEKYSPSPSTISDEEFDKLVLDVKKNTDEAISELSDINTLKRLALFLAKKQ
jgi:hypothetical protein